MITVVIGGGAAGFFGAIAIAEGNPAMRVLVLERGNGCLQKVKVSGGGRCNVTHACFDPRELARNYPRGERELNGPFHRFGPSDTVKWFAARGVTLKTESDGRMFPTTDDSQTIVDCLWNAAKKCGVDVRTGHRVEQLQPLPDGRWRVVANQTVLEADFVLVATGSSEAVWNALARMGHTIVPPVPSLFTFNIKDERLKELPGISVPKVTVTAPALKQRTQGAILVTHWGLSGPAILRLSAWGARHLAQNDYRFELVVNWLDNLSIPDALAQLNAYKSELSKKQIAAHAQFGLPARLWQSLCSAAQVPETLRWADLGKKQLTVLAEQLTASKFAVNGKSTFKEEFVTAGGIALKEVNFKTFESKRYPGLYFAGEVLDIDAITGGFNFQAAWTGGYLVGEALKGAGG